jgi:hypothetical protein
MSQTWTNNDEGPGGTDVPTGFVNLEAKLDSVRSNFSGTAFPTDADRAVGQFCVRTDESPDGLYMLTTKAADPNDDVWTKLPNAITAFAQTLLNAANAAAANALLGLGTAALASTGTGASNVPTVTQASSLYLSRALNLSDLANVATARSNLGLGALALLSVVGTSNLANNSVTGEKIPNGTITPDKLASGAQGGWTIKTKNVNYTAASGEFVSASTMEDGPHGGGGPVGVSWTLTLPVSPTTGQRVGVYLSDVIGTNKVTVSGGSKDIGAAGTSVILYVPGDTLQLIYNGTKWVPTAGTCLAPHLAKLTLTNYSRTSSFSTLLDMGLNTEEINRGLVTNLSIGRITTQRAGKYRVSGLLLARQFGPAYWKLGFRINSQSDFSLVGVVTEPNTSDGNLTESTDWAGPSKSTILNLGAGDTIHLTTQGMIPAGGSYMELVAEELLTPI